MSLSWSWGTLSTPLKLCCADLQDGSFASLCCLDQTLYIESNMPLDAWPISGIFAFGDTLGS